MTIYRNLYRYSNFITAETALTDLKFVKRVGDYYPLANVLRSVSRGSAAPKTLNFLQEVSEIEPIVFDSLKYLSSYYFKDCIFRPDGSYSSSRTYKSGITPSLRLTSGLIYFRMEELVFSIMVHKDNIDEVKLSILERTLVDPNSIVIWMKPVSLETNAFYKKSLKRLRTEGIIEGVEVVESKELIDKVSINVQPIYTNPKSFDKFALEFKSEFLHLYKDSMETIRSKLALSQTKNIQVDEYRRFYIDSMGMEFVENVETFERRRTFIVGLRRI